MNKFKEGFYFEKYKTVEEAKNALLGFHPLGSNTGELIKTLDIATKNKTIFNPKEDFVEDRISDKGNYIYFSYEINKIFYFYTEWRIIIDINSEDNNAISNITVHKFFHTL